MPRQVPPDLDTVEPFNLMSCTHTALRQASRQLTQVYDDAIASSGLTSSQAMLVTRLDELGGAPGGTGPSLQALAKRLSIQISALTHALRPLVRDGVLELHADPKDGRIKRAVLTEKGMAQTQQMYALWAETNRRIEAALGSGSTEQLRQLATQVASPEFMAALGTERKG